MATKRPKLICVSRRSCIAITAALNLTLTASFHEGTVALAFSPSSFQNARQATRPSPRRSLERRPVGFLTRHIDTAIGSSSCDDGDDEHVGSALEMANGSHPIASLSAAQEAKEADKGKEAEEAKEAGRTSAAANGETEESIENDDSGSFDRVEPIVGAADQGVNLGSENSAVESSPAAAAAADLKELAAETTELAATDATDAAPPVASEEARTLLALELSGAGEEGMPFAPMMTYQKYLTMQEKRVKVTIRYSASAGLRPFYLTVANQIKSTHPDVLLEKRILPPVGSDAGGDQAIFEIAIDGKTVVGKKATKLLKVRSSSSSRNDNNHNTKEEKNGNIVAGGKNGGNNGLDQNQPDIAGGRSIFVSMDKLDQELHKARRRRRPSTSYQRREVASGVDSAGFIGGPRAAPNGDRSVSSVGGEIGSRDETLQIDIDAIKQSDGVESVGGVEMQGQEGTGAPAGMTEAVIRLERLKALSTRKKVDLF